jgi:hypothetical protein
MCDCDIPIEYRENRKSLRRGRQSSNESTHETTDQRGRSNSKLEGEGEGEGEYKEWLEFQKVQIREWLQGVVAFYIRLL